MNVLRNAASRFWAKVTPAAAVDCWEWSAHRECHRTEVELMNATDTMTGW